MEQDWDDGWDGGWGDAVDGGDGGSDFMLDSAKYDAGAGYVPAEPWASGHSVLGHSQWDPAVSDHQLDTVGPPEGGVDQIPDSRQGLRVHSVPSDPGRDLNTLEAYRTFFRSVRDTLWMPTDQGRIAVAAALDDHDLLLRDCLQAEAAALQALKKVSPPLPKPGDQPEHSTIQRPIIGASPVLKGADSEFSELLFARARRLGGSTAEASRLRSAIEDAYVQARSIPDRFGRQKSIACYLGLKIGEHEQIESVENGGLIPSPELKAAIGWLVQHLPPPRSALE